MVTFFYLSRALDSMTHEKLLKSLLKVDIIYKEFKWFDLIFNLTDRATECALQQKIVDRGCKCSYVWKYQSQVRSVNLGDYNLPQVLLGRHNEVAPPAPKPGLPRPLEAPCYNKSWFHLKWGRVLKIFKLIKFIYYTLLWSSLVFIFQPYFKIQSHLKSSFQNQGMREYWAKISLCRP